MQEFLESVPIIDTHMHRILPEKEPDFGQIAGGSIAGPDQERHARRRVLFSMLTQALREEFAMEDDTPAEEVEAERERRVKSDSKGYYRDCFHKENVAMYCIETGAPLRCPALTEKENCFFDDCLPEGRYCVVLRVERFVEELLPLGLPFSEFEHRLYDTICSEIRRQNAVALKSAVAYYGGLRVLLPTPQEAAKAYEQILAGHRGAEQERIFFSYTLMLGAMAAYDQDIPIQIHTGPGNGLFLDHTSFNPVCLNDFLRDPRILNRTRIVLLHCGQPYEEETGFLVSQYSNVYTDVSQTVVFSSLCAVQKLRELLEYAPMDKVMYGSDCVLFPELVWFAARRLRQVTGHTMEQLFQEGYLSRGEAEAFARGLFYENACSCYTRLPALIEKSLSCSARRC